MTDGASSISRKRWGFRRALSAAVVTAGGLMSFLPACTSRSTEVADVDSPRPSQTARADGALAEIDLGFVEPGAASLVGYEIPNRLDRPIRIAGAVSGCECMVVEACPEQIEAGKAGIVIVRFIAWEKAQNYSNKVVLMTDDPNRRQIELGLKARIGLPLRPAPAVREFGKLKLGESKSTSVVLANDSGQPVKLLFATCSDKSCSVQVPRAEVPPGGTLEIPATVVASAKPGEYDVRVTFHTDCPTQQYVLVRVKYTVGRDGDG